MASTKCAAGLTLTWGVIGSVKSMMFEEIGGQQLVCLAPEGRSGGPHLVISGGEIGAARDNESLLRVP